MFVLLSEYRGSQEELAEHLDAHHAWAHRYYESGHFLVGGRRVPPTGGIGILRASSREEVEEIVREDPWFAHDLIAYEIEEFEESQLPNRSAGADDFLRSPLSSTR